MSVDDMNVPYEDDVESGWSGTHSEEAAEEASEQQESDPTSAISLPEGFRKIMAKSLKPVPVKRIIHPEVVEAWTRQMHSGLLLDYYNQAVRRKVNFAALHDVFALNDGGHLARRGASHQPSRDPTSAVAAGGVPCSSAPPDGAGAAAAGEITTAQPLMQVPVNLPANVQPAPQETVMRFCLGDAFVEVSQMPARRGRWRRPTPYQQGNNRRGNQ
ncbi:hypothetical protein GE061_015377 [Apolygus lucorum]|uniref:Uncharacterized protein n=1 Tax=Apolygus lucorum TaxID=248454 RepID=A0A8S9XLX0_APOLU|nr:hypothetical protein GE061_015377 [Apolygus lucorum]